MRSSSGAGALVAIAVLTACASPTDGARTASPGHVEGTVTNITVSDHPEGICDPQYEYTDVVISFSAKGSNERSFSAPVTPAEIVTRDPCTTVGSFSIDLDPNKNYEACIDSTTHDPNAMDIVGGGTCGIDVTPEILLDGRFDITFDSRKTGSKDYSTYS
jgi:hypothetical protein